MSKKIKSVCQVITVQETKITKKFVCIGTPEEIDGVVAEIVAPAHKKKFLVTFPDGSTQQVTDLPINGHSDLVFNDAGLIKYKRAIRNIGADGSISFTPIKNVWRKY